MVLLQYIRYGPIISFQLNNQVSVIPIIASESGPSFGDSVKFDPEGWRVHYSFALHMVITEPRAD